MAPFNRILLMLLALSILAGCNLPVSNTPQPATPTEQDKPTQVTPPTDTPQPPTPTEIPATDTPIPPQPTEALSFTEEFSAGLENWSYFLTQGEDAKTTVSIADDALSVVLLEQNIWAYITYDQSEYKRVELSTTAENRGANVNNISLVCQYSPLGWYEFNISSAGVYNILAYDSMGAMGEQGYNLLKEGTSTLIKTGFGTNSITAVCDGNNLTFKINDEEVATLIDEKFLYFEGKVGLSVKSLEQKPVAVLFDSFTVTVK
jgi:hypothetical protein